MGRGGWEEEVVEREEVSRESKGSGEVMEIKEMAGEGGRR